MSGFRAAHALVYAFSGAAQFQIVAGETAGIDPDLLEQTRAAAAAAAADATATRFPAGRSGRRGRLSWFAVAVPTSAVEAMSGRDGLAVSFVIISRGLRLPPTDFFRDALAALETGLRRAVPGTRGLRDGSQLLASALQRGDGGDAVAGALAAYTGQVTHLLDAMAGTHRAAGLDGEVPTRADPLPYEVLATLVEGTRTARRAQQCLVAYLGDPVPFRATARAHRLAGDLVVLSQDVP
ncbi:hypothetical protein [Actinoplanes sp. NPDC049802]|uniref:hypothetical protein n=1 Tax=Actinoplanes sp. NPDC049802 TaxID=3154742 RepID=UPI0033F881F0